MELTIQSATTTQALHKKAVLDENLEAAGIKVSDQELTTLNIDRDGCHGKRNDRVLLRNWFT